MLALMLLTLQVLALAALVHMADRRANARVESYEAHTVVDRLVSLRAALIAHALTGLPRTELHSRAIRNASIRIERARALGVSQ